MGGQIHQNNVAASAICDLPSSASLHSNSGHTGDAGDAVMARWLQSAGLQHLASPSSSSGVDARLLPTNIPTQTAEDKQRIFKLMRGLNFNGESFSDPFTIPQTSSGMGIPDGNYCPEFRGDFGAGLLDLHAMDDTELLSEHITSDPFEPSPFMPGGRKSFDADIPVGLSMNGKESGSRENNVAKIKVVVRKRPLNRKELSRKEDDIVTVNDSSYLTLHEPKLKVDLTAYVERHEFCFDAVLDEYVTNDEVYRETVEPIIPTIFQRTKATCFAYGQTGSGKTFTMQPLPLRATEDLVRLLHKPAYANQRFKLWLSYFEIYGGKLFDLLNDRKKLCMREDGRQQVCIVGLQEFEVMDLQIVKEYIERGNSARSTGSTGANEESSRSHAILQLAIKKQVEVKDKRSNDVNVGKVVGKISFIDLAGSERGADTTDNDKQTRMEGAEINKSLLALKECIRALDNDQTHIPFRGSKLTEVLRDSFVGNSRTVMISCISPNAGSCEHTLNTLRYADRVKSLSKTGNSRKDQTVNSQLGATRESSSVTFASFTELEEVYERGLEYDRYQSGVSPSGQEELGGRPETRGQKPTSRVQNIVAAVDRNSRPLGFGFVPSEPDLSCDVSLNGLLEEEDTLISAHKKEIEDTMEIVREEMKLLAEVDRPGSSIDGYVNQLSLVLSRKAAGLVSLQSRLAQFQHRLKEQQIILQSQRKVAPRR